MTTYRLDKLVLVPALTSYTTALIALAHEHSAALAGLPTVAADLAALEAATAAAAAADEAWEAASLERDVALALRDGLFAQAMAIYKQHRDWLPTLIAKDAEGTAVRQVLGRCKSPGALRVSSLPAAMNTLAAGIEKYPAQFASAGLGAAQAAELRAQVDALVAASEAFDQVDLERGVASDRRDQARASLVACARLIEDYLERLGGSDARAAMARLRIQHLPRKSRGKAEAAGAGG